MIKVNILVVSLLAVVGRIEEKLAEEGGPRHHGRKANSSNWLVLLERSL